MQRVVSRTFAQQILSTSEDKFAKKLQIRVKEMMQVNPKNVVGEQKLLDRFKLEDLLKRRFFYAQSFEIYGGVSGLYDYGPMGCALKSNIVQQWRKHFVLAENMLEVECSALTPEAVLRASGHVDRFVDWMVKDVITKECFRADHLIKNKAEELLKQDAVSPAIKTELEDVLNRLDGLNNKEMDGIISKYNFKSPSTGNDLTESNAFNLMFPTQIGPTGEFEAYLRPETAQGIFINFNRLLEFNQGRLPFAAAQIGTGFRNEISPRQGLIRVREFTMCEIEHFVDPANKTHPKFQKIAALEMTLFTAGDQVDNKKPLSMPIGKAVALGIVDNETLGYYMARTHLFLISVGVHQDKLRFRQHMSNEMAHYAKDCWDAECLTSYGWIECVGHADRACYDLNSHSAATNVKLVAEKRLNEPKTVTVLKPIWNKGIVGAKFKAESKTIMYKVDKYDEKQMKDLQKQLNELAMHSVTVNGTAYELTKEMLEVKEVETTKHVEHIVPSVIEPSFGIGRVMYTVLEHAFRQRESDEKRLYLEIPALVAPIKCSILPIVKKEIFIKLLELVQEELENYELSYKLDDGSGSLGRRYARTDEIGIPFGVTVDYESENEPHTVTLRHAHTTQQIRLEITKLGKVVEELVKGQSIWEELIQKYPVVKNEV